jgi:hypothetical protein
MDGTHRSEVRSFFLCNLWLCRDKSVELCSGLRHGWLAARGVIIVAAPTPIGNMDCSLSVGLLPVELAEMVSRSTVLAIWAPATCGLLRCPTWRSCWKNLMDGSK